MRILFVTPSPPHPTEGGAAIRNWHLITAAKDAGHRVEVLAVTDERVPVGTDGFDVQFVARRDRARSHRLRQLLTKRTPDLAQRLQNPTFVQDVQRKLRTAHDAALPFHVVQVEGLEMWDNLPHARRHGHDAYALPRTIYDAHNAEATLQQRAALASAKTGDVVGAAYSAMQWAKLRTYERGVVRAATATLALSREDACALESLAGRPVDVVPVGVDTAHYSLDAPELPPPIPFDVVFSGTLDYRPNADAARWFVTAVWPLIRAIRPGTTLALVGRNPSPQLWAYSGHQGITVTGAVPDDRPYMAGAKVYALPLRFGAGVRLKLLNAMSMNCAVLTTPAAAEGVEVLHGQNVLIAPPRVDSFAAGIIMMLKVDEARTRFGESARRLMVERHDWSHATPALLAVYDRIAHASLPRYRSRNASR